MNQQLHTHVKGLLCSFLLVGCSNCLDSQIISTPDALNRPTEQITIVSGTVFQDNSGSIEKTYDARGWSTNTSSIFPVKIGNITPGTRQVWVGGEITGQQSRDLTWKEMHTVIYDGAAITLKSNDYLVVDGLRTDNVMDAVRPRGNASVFRASNILATYIRDDAVENDNMMGGVIDDCLFDGCYMFLSQQTQPEEGSIPWSTLDSLKVTNTLVRLEPMPYSTNVKGNPPQFESLYGVNADRHGQLFKHHGPGDAPLIVSNCIFYVPQHSLNGTASMDFPGFEGCRYSNNILLWTGGGSYPGALPASGVTEYNLINSTQEQIDQIWETAVTDWISRHGYDVMPYLLNVENGSGDGEYPPGTEVVIQADAPPAGKAFDRWVGDIAYVADPYDTVTTVTMPMKGVSLAATYKSIKYALTVTNGYGDGDYYMGTRVTINADLPPTGKKFEMWTGDVAFAADPYSSTTTVTMPPSAIILTATYSDLTFTLTVNNGSGGGEYIIGAEVPIEADASPEGNKFELWTGDTAFVADPFDSITSVIMPMSDISLTALYTSLVNALNVTPGNRFLFYPNPSSGRIFIEGAGSENRVIIKNIAGRTVKIADSKDVAGTWISLEELDPGVYMILTTDGKTGSGPFKLIKL
jgi:hypothetical protein